MALALVLCISASIPDGTGPTPSNIFLLESKEMVRMRVPLQAEQNDTRQVGTLWQRRAEKNLPLPGEDCIHRGQPETAQSNIYIRGIQSIKFLLNFRNCTFPVFDH